MSQQILRLYTDRLSAGASSTELAPTTRTIYVADGTAVLRGAGHAASIAANCAWQGPAAISITAGPAGARLLRWELSTREPQLLAGTALTSELTLAGEPQIKPGIDYLMRCDRVGFRPVGSPIHILIRVQAFAVCRAAASASTRSIMTFGSSPMERGSRAAAIRSLRRLGARAPRTSSA